MSERRAEVQRTTTETDIALTLASTARASPR